MLDALCPLLGEQAVCGAAADRLGKGASTRAMRPLLHVRTTYSLSEA
jgi:hypothetical protein